MSGTLVLHVGDTAEDTHMTVNGKNVQLVQSIKVDVDINGKRLITAQLLKCPKAHEELVEATKLLNSMHASVSYVDCDGTSCGQKEVHVYHYRGPTQDALDAYAEKEAKAAAKEEASEEQEEMKKQA